MKTTERNRFKKRRNHNLLWCMTLLLTFSLSFAACEGPQGPQGERGLQGEQGPVGPAGENGSMMHAGEGAPSAGLGSIGDFYLDQTSSELYGPKNEADGWGVPIDLKGANGQDGADGQDGQDGSKIYSGTSTPASSLGNPEDFYLNKSTFDLYGPKTTGDWGTPINLQGNANVMYSSWIDANWNKLDDPKRKLMRIPINQLDNSDLRNNTLVMVYARQFGTSSIYPLPSSGRWSNVFYSYRFGNNQNDLGGLLIEVESTDGTDLREIEYAAFRGNRYRYILIPGSNQVGSVASADALPIDLNDYEQVEKYFGMRN